MAFYVYILQCSDNSLYTGYTTDVASRVQKHNTGKGAKYTRGRLPVSVVYTETLPTKSAALSREAEIKHLSRPEKIQLISESELQEIS